jgi:hypothetical protein
MAKKKNDSLMRVATYLARDRAKLLRDELTRPWRRGRRTPEAEAGRWFGLGLALGAAAVGAGLALLVTQRES